jgi:hypothetical protein
LEVLPFHDQLRETLEFSAKHFSGNTIRRQAHLVVVDLTVIDGPLKADTFRLIVAGGLAAVGMDPEAPPYLIDLALWLPVTMSRRTVLEA